MQDTHIFNYNKVPSPLQVFRFMAEFILIWGLFGVAGDGFWGPLLGPGEMGI
jgi:hypothetical protein